MGHRTHIEERSPNESQLLSLTLTNDHGRCLLAITSDWPALLNVALFADGRTR